MTIQLEEILDKARHSASVRDVYGEPYERDGVTIIPVARRTRLSDSAARRSRARCSVRSMSAIVRDVKLMPTVPRPETGTTTPP